MAPRNLRLIALAAILGFVLWFAARLINQEPKARPVPHLKPTPILLRSAFNSDQVDARNVLPKAVVVCGENLVHEANYDVFGGWNGPPKIRRAGVMRGSLGHRRRVVQDLLREYFAALKTQLRDGLDELGKEVEGKIESEPTAPS